MLDVTLISPAVSALSCNASVPRQDRCNWALQLKEPCSWQAYIDTEAACQNNVHSPWHSHLAVPAVIHCNLGWDVCCRLGCVLQVRTCAAGCDVCSRLGLVLRVGVVLQVGRCAAAWEVCCSLGCVLHIAGVHSNSNSFFTTVQGYMLLVSFWDAPKGSQCAVQMADIREGKGSLFTVQLRYLTRLTQ